MSTNLFVTDDIRIGRDGIHRRLQVSQDDGDPLPVIWFYGADAELPTGAIDLVYAPRVNEYRGERSVQLGFVAARPTQSITIVPAPTTEVERKIVDLRNQSIDPDALPIQEAANWYAEGVQMKVDNGAGVVSFAPRSYLPLGDKGLPLVIWSVPPSTGLLRWLIETTEPRTIYICGQSTTDDRLSSLLRHVAGMCKYALQRDNVVHLDRMAARLGTTEAVVRHSLLWLESKGIIQIVDWNPPEHPLDSVLIQTGDSREDQDKTAILQAELDTQIAEVRAYRRYFLRAALADLGLYQDR